MKKKEAFCTVCNKHTTHTYALEVGLVCDNEHENDGVCCHRCGDKLEEDVIKIAKVLGANQVVCRKCRGVKVKTKRKG